MNGTRNNTSANRRRLAASARRRERRWAAIVDRCREAGSRMVVCDDAEMGTGNSCDGSAWDRVRASNSRHAARLSAEGHEAAAEALERQGR